MCKAFHITTRKSTTLLSQDISDLRVRYPHTHLNHLSCDEARNHFGGIISVVPLAVTCAKDAVERIEVTRAYRHMPVFKGDCAGEEGCETPDLL